MRVQTITHGRCSRSSVRGSPCANRSWSRSLPERIAELEEALGNASSQVEFVDMTEIGANPACIIPEWRRFLRDNAADGSVRGVGEPAWPGRRDVEFAEAELHESLINLAFDDGPAWRLLCPYDYTALPSEILEEALRVHPVVHNGFGSTMPLPANGSEHAFAKDLPSAPAGAMRIDFGPNDLTVIRGIVRRVVDSSTFRAKRPRTWCSPPTRWRPTASCTAGAKG